MRVFHVGIDGLTLGVSKKIIIYASTFAWQERLRYAKVNSRIFEKSYNMKNDYILKLRNYAYGFYSKKL